MLCLFGVSCGVCLLKQLLERFGIDPDLRAICKLKHIVFDAEHTRFARSCNTWLKDVAQFVNGTVQAISGDVSSEIGPEQFHDVLFAQSAVRAAEQAAQERAGAAMLPYLRVNAAPLVSIFVLNIKLTKEIDAQDEGRCGAGKHVMGYVFLFTRQSLLR